MNGREDNDRVIIKTFSNINTDVQACLAGGSISCQVDKLESFRSERQLQARIKYFWTESTANLLVLQCDPSITSEGCMKLARFTIDHHRKRYRQATGATSKITKCAIIIVHIRRDAFTTSGERVGLFPL